MENRILDILVPTYNRPNCIEKLLDNFKSISDKRLRVLINSNGPFTQQHKIPVNDTVFCLSNFPENKGAAQNFKYLLNKSTSKYSMYLSDEDSIQPSQIEKALNLLESNEVESVLFDVIDRNEIILYSSFKNRDLPIDFNKALSIGMPRTTYMSGYTFKRSALSINQIDKSFELYTGNVYYHLNLLDLILTSGGKVMNGKIPLIVKGDEAMVGGDAYSNINEVRKQFQFLNPKIYGNEARINQFTFRKNFIEELQTSRFNKTLYKLINLIFFLGRVLSNSKFGSKNIIKGPLLIGAVANKNKGAIVLGKIILKLYHKLWIKQ